MHRLLGVVLAVAVAALAWTWWDTASGPARPATVRPDPAFAMIVTYVVDGDTLEARVVTPNPDVGTTRPVRIRLIGVDAPEDGASVQCGGPQATAWLRATLPVGTRVRVAADQEPRDGHGRLLLYVWRAESFVNRQLARQGLARTLRIWPNVAFHRRILEAQEQARRGGKGLWGTC